MVGAARPSTGARSLRIQRQVRGPGCRFSGLGRLLSGRRLLGRKPGLLGLVICLAPLRIGECPRALRDRVLIRRFAFSLTTCKELEARGSGRCRSTRRRGSLPAVRSEDRRELDGVIAGIVDGSEAGDVELAIQRSGPQRSPFGRAAGGSRLERGADPAAGLVTGPVCGAFEHINGGPSRTLDAIAKAAGGEMEILAGLCARSDVLLSIAGIGSGREQLGDQRRVFDGELVDGPHTDRRFAKFADRVSGIPIGGSKFAYQGGAARDEFLERSVIEAGCVHGSAV